MRNFVAFLVTVTAAVLLQPSALHAQDSLSLDELLSTQPDLVLVPKLQLTDCAPDRKCLDLESYRSYLLMRVQYVWLFKVHTELWPVISSELKNSSDALDEIQDILKAWTLRSADAYADLYPKYIAVQRENAKLHGRSILGGGLPWVAVFTLTGLVAGVMVGAVYF